METEPEEAQQPGPQAPQPTPVSQEQPLTTAAPDHGATGNGAESAMARLISQEQSRAVPVSADDAADSSF